MFYYQNIKLSHSYYDQYSSSKTVFGDVFMASFSFRVKTYNTPTDVQRLICLLVYIKCLPVCILVRKSYDQDH